MAVKVDHSEAMINDSETERSYKEMWYPVHYPVFWYSVTGHVLILNYLKSFLVHRNRHEIWTSVSIAAHATGSVSREDDDDGGGGDDDGGGVDDQCEVAIWQEQVGEDLLVCTKVNLLQREKYVIASQSKSSNDFEICFPEHLNCQI